jgi:hypothetical protein
LGSKIRILSQVTKSDQKVWLRIEAGVELLWVPQESLSANSGGRKSSGFWSSWRWGAEGIVYMNGSADDYEGLKTDVPNPNNVGTLQDPIITKVSKGSGAGIRVFAERPVYSLFRAQAGVGFRDQKYTYTYKPNPSLGAVTLAELPSYEKEFHLKQIQFDIGAGLRHQFDNWYLGYGLQLNLLYSLSNKVEIPVLVPSGVFFKNTPATVKDGPDAIGYEILGRVDVRWKDFMLSVGMTPAAAYQFSIGYLL